MEGIIFYFVSWTFWIIYTFFISKNNRYRMVLSASILLLIIFSHQTISIVSSSISIGAIFILLTMYGACVKLALRSLSYMLICNLIIIMAYVSFHLFAFFDPVWVVFPQKWMCAVMLVFLTVLLQKEMKKRIILLFLGLINGDAVYAFILGKYPFPYVIGDFALLDVLALSAGLLACWQVIIKLTAYIEEHFNHAVKERQKLS